MKTALLITIILLSISKMKKSEAGTLPVCQDFECHMRSLRPTVSNLTVIHGLIRRVLPKHVDSFFVEINHDIGPDGKDTFLIEAQQGKVALIGSSAIALGMGFHYYLKYFCKLHVSWSGNQLEIDDLPLPTKPVKIISNDGFRYYENVCTSSYSMVWWDWDRWEREIDWMALNGINLPLAFTAQEAIWYRVYKHIGLSDSEINEYFTGPAFLAWNRMGNLQGFGGPLSQAWHVKRVALQHQILNRMKEYGMIPVLPAFAGRVPPSFTRLFPDALIVNDTGHWGHFDPPYCCTSFLEPQDPLFITIGSLFVSEYIKEFGTSHVYNTDLFNEMPSPSSDPEYLASCGKAVFESLTLLDPKAVWVMQGWIFVNDPTLWQPPQTKALLTSVPLGRMVILDLESEFFPQYQRFESYYGQPFIWCMLHNFGGVLGLYGAFDPVNQGTFMARNFPNSTMIGTGLTPEGIEKNDVMFEFMNEMAWRNEPVSDIDEWVSYYARCRYGKDDPNLSQAWKLLRRSVYNANSTFINHGQYIIVTRPGLNKVPLLWYDPMDVYNALAYFEKSENDTQLQSQETFRYDFIDLGRQVFQLAFANQYLNLRHAYNEKDLDALTNATSSMLHILNELDALLSTDEHFRLDTWVSSAKKWASTPEEENQLVYNARNQITLWGPTGQLIDYATKQWSGVISGYCRPRWELFFDTLSNSITRGTPFNQNDFNKKVLWFVEEPFTHQTDTKSTEVQTSDDSLDLPRSIIQRNQESLYSLLSTKPDFSSKTTTKPKPSKKWWKKKKLTKSKDRSSN